MLRLLMALAAGRWVRKVAQRLADAAEQDAADERREADAGDRELVYPRVQRAAMGSLFEIYLVGYDRDALTGAAEEALDEICRQDRQLSHYRDESDITRINHQAATEWVRVDPDLYRLLRRCARLAEETGGAFDITTGPLIKAWGFHEGDHRVPGEEELRALVGRTGPDGLLFDDTLSSIAFARPGVEIGLGAIGKGHAIDEAAKVLRFHGVDNAVIHGGQSTILAIGEGPEGDGWPFSVKDPRDRETCIEDLRLRDEAISTSGSYEQFFEQDGVRYSHILDPRTGRPCQGMLSVSVIGPSAAETDALSTAAFVLGAEAGAALIAGRPGHRALLLEELEEGSGRQATRVGF